MGYWHLGNLLSPAPRTHSHYHRLDMDVVDASDISCLGSISGSLAANVTYKYCGYSFKEQALSPVVELFQSYFSAVSIPEASGYQ